MSQTIIYVHVNIILDFPVTYRNDSVVCQSECTCLHKTVNVVFFTKKIRKYLPKRESTHANVQSCRSNEKEGITYYSSMVNCGTVLSASIFNHT